MKCYIGLGSNLGDSVNTLKSALAALQHHPGIHLTNTSSFYQSKPHGPADQPDYINAVAEIETTLNPHDLLDALQAIEQHHHRQRDGERWGPRTLDLDLLLYGDSSIQSSRLTVPHPQIGKRNFVLYPLAEISRNIIFPDGSTLSAHLSHVADDDLIKLDSP